MGGGSSKVLQNKLDSLPVWDSRFNPSKCQVVRVTSSRRPIDNRYHLHGQLLEVVTSARYLEVDISNGLSWTSYIDRITGNANSTVGFLRRNLKQNYPR